MAKRVNIQAHPSQLLLEKFDSNILLELFPFAIILDENMNVKRCGEKLLETWIIQNPNVKPNKFYNSVVTKYFKLRRPKGITFDWKTVTMMHTVIFELELIRPQSEDDENDSANKSNDVVEEGVMGVKQISLDDAGAVGGAVGDVGTVAAAANIRGTTGNYRLLLKGQMRYISDIDSIVFLCSPL